MQHCHCWLKTGHISPSLPPSSERSKSWKFVCCAKNGRNGNSSGSSPVDPDLVIPPPRQGSQYQQRLPESAYSYGGDAGGGKGKQICHTITRQYYQIGARNVLQTFLCVHDIANMCILSFYCTHCM